MEFFKKTHFTNRIIWISLVFIVWYILLGSMLILPFDKHVTGRTTDIPDLHFVLDMYTCTIITVITFVLLCLLKKNRDIGKSMLPNKETGSWRMLWFGLLLGFLTNFFCILCALIHGDIKLVLDFAPSGIPLMIFALISVFIQSSSEEIWCRGFMYERINVHYPLWVAIVVNGSFFGLLHATNPGISAIAMTGLIITGLSYSLLRWYSGSIWTCMGIHTMWNFTQNLIFGLPNSGLVSETSIFHLDAANGISNLIYDFDFGVEGALPALFIDASLGVIILIMAKKNGRLDELKMTKEKTAELTGYAPAEVRYPIKKDKTVVIEEY
ncbi:MAG: CPBP family intramembrane metalloprotease [Mogibacterium sp.]|nr:CPBP family intramembrane metalloprotease [Mogibacterium sp.]